MNEEKDIFDFIEKRKVETPDKAYFDDLAQRVIDSQKTKIIPFYKRPIVWIGSAAAAVLILFTVNFNPPQPPTSNGEQELIQSSPSHLTTLLEKRSSNT